ncbi:hypothetical protein PLICRDRAFT_175668 [Plicaturopsis crispa FD-325 SS-3]|nr:hypothetical protein PLICRDRAFT_175668 [Plicaturopsis crispa FD-325 SS-3]
MSNAALDVLWRCQPTIGHLVQTMAPDLWRRGLDDRLHLRRRIRPVDWKGRINLYAPRIQTISGPSVYDLAANHLDPLSAYELMITAPPSQPFLPNLNDLTVDAEVVSVIRLYRSLTVTRMRLPFIDDFPMRSAFINNISAIFPGLQHVDTVDTRVDTVLSTTIAHSSLMSSLTVLTCGDLSADAFIDLSVVSHLREIKFHWSEDSFDALFASINSAKTLTHWLRVPPFPSLSHISIDIFATINSVIPIIVTINCQLLKSITLTLRKDNYSASAADLTSLFHVLRRRSGGKPRILEKLYIRLCEFANPLSEGMPDASVLSIASLRPLLSFHCLRHFECSVSAYELEDCDVMAMAVAWPSIESLYLFHGYGSRGFSRTTMVGVSALIRHCPELKSLHLGIDATDVALHVPSYLHASPNYSMDTLVFGASPVESPLAVASFLAAISPRVRVNKFPLRIPATSYHGSVAPDLADNYIKRWCRVDAFLRYGVYPREFSGGHQGSQVSTGRKSNFDADESDLSLTTGTRHPG